MDGRRTDRESERVGVRTKALGVALIATFAAVSTVSPVGSLASEVDDTTATTVAPAAEPEAYDQVPSF